jgi:hypothetical protein
MPRIKIGDLADNVKITKELMRKISGGSSLEVNIITLGDGLSPVDWSPDGPYIPIGGDETGESKKPRVYKFKKNGQLK